MLRTTMFAAALLVEILFVTVLFVDLLIALCSCGT